MSDLKFDAIIKLTSSDFEITMIVKASSLHFDIKIDTIKILNFEKVHL